MRYVDIYERDKVGEVVRLGRVTDTGQFIGLPENLAEDLQQIRLDGKAYTPKDEDYIVKLPLVLCGIRLWATKVQQSE